MISQGNCKKLSVQLGYLLSTLLPDWTNQRSWRDLLDVSKLFLLQEFNQERLIGLLEVRPHVTLYDSFLVLCRTASTATCSQYVCEWPVI
jgi:hypothetical protein